MGLSIDDLAAKTKKTKVDYMGQSTVVEYRPNYLTNETMSQDTTTDEAFHKLFSNLITDWDVTYQGRKLDPSKLEDLQKIPILFLRAVYGQILADGENFDEGKASNAG